MLILFPLLLNIALYNAAELTMLVLNLANYNDWGDWLARLQKIEQYIAQEKVDIMFFSEVRFDTGENSTAHTYMNMAEQLVDHLRMDGIQCRVHTDPAMYYGRYSFEKPQFSTFWEGLTTVVCNDMVEVITSEVMFFNSDAHSSDSNKRIAQYIRFQYNMSVFGCVNSHWSNDVDDRIIDVHETLVRLTEYQDVQQQPNIVVGDLNAEIDISIPDSALVILSEAGWVDVYREKYSDAEANPGYTLFYQREKRVDYIWANDQFYPGISKIEIVGKRKHDNSSDWWSDHAGLQISVDVNSFKKATTDMEQDKIMFFSRILIDHPSLSIAILIFLLISILFILVKVVMWLISSGCICGSKEYNRLNQQNKSDLVSEIETVEIPPDVDLKTATRLDSWES